jgi:hypothetical protein
MSSDYEKILEDANAKLTESVVKEQEQADVYKGYMELLQKGCITNYKPYEADPEDGWTPWMSIIGQKKKKPTQRLEITIYAEDFHDFPLIHDKIDQYQRERKRLYIQREEAEVLWEKRKKIITTILISVGIVAAVCGLGWLTWIAYFIPV